MSLLSLILILAFIGGIAYCIVTYIPMPQPIKTLILIVAVGTCVLMVLNAAGVIDEIRGVQVPKVR